MSGTGLEDSSLNFALSPPAPTVRLHLLLLVVLFHAFSDLFKVFFKKLGNVADKLHLKTGGEEPEKLTLKDMSDLSKVFTKNNLRPFRLLKGLTVFLAFLSEFALPYVLFGRTTRAFRTNFEKQVHSYSPFTLVTCRAPKSHRDFFLPKKELEQRMQKELEEEQNYSLNLLEFFESLNDLPDDSTEEVQKKLDAQLEKDTKKYHEEKGLDTTSKLYTDYKIYSEKEVFVLSSFNRFVAFTLSKVALRGLYVAFHALLSPHNHNAWLNTFKKK